jgi:hypothetical protein
MASCEVAAQTASRLGLPHDVQLGLRHYSEWWNGKGVPEGVKGDEIALIARVVHVASVGAKFDVLGVRTSQATRSGGALGASSIPAIAATSWRTPTSCWRPHRSAILATGCSKRSRSRCASSRRRD